MQINCIKNLLIRWKPVTVYNNQPHSPRAPSISAPNYWLEVGQEATDDYDTHLGYIRWVQVGAVLAKTSGVKDYEELMVNGGTVNIAVTQVQFPVTLFHPAPDYFWIDRPGSKDFRKNPLPPVFQGQCFIVLKTIHPFPDGYARKPKHSGVW